MIGRFFFCLAARDRVNGPRKTEMIKNLIRFHLQVVGSAPIFCHVHVQYLQGASIDYLYTLLSFLGIKLEDIHMGCSLSWQGVNNPSAVLCVPVGGRHGN